MITLLAKIVHKKIKLIFYQQMRLKLIFFQYKLTLDNEGSVQGTLSIQATGQYDL